MISSITTWFQLLLHCVLPLCFLQRETQSRLRRVPVAHLKIRIRITIVVWYRGRAELSPAHFGGENNSSLSTDFVLKCHLVVSDDLPKSNLFDSTLSDGDFASCGVTC